MSQARPGRRENHHPPIRHPSLGKRHKNQAHAGGEGKGKQAGRGSDLRGTAPSPPKAGEGQKIGTGNQEGRYHRLPPPPAAGRAGVSQARPGRREGHYKAREGEPPTQA